MASVPLATWPDEAQETHRSRLTLVPTPAPRLSALEWSVVAMAERDGLASLREPGRFAAALGSLFGLTPPNRLANARLEALRRVAVHAWRNGWNVPDSELRAFVEAGFSLDHYELIQASIHKSRANARRQGWVK